MKEGGEGGGGEFSESPALPGSDRRLGDACLRERAALRDLCGGVHPGLQLPHPFLRGGRKPPLALQRLLHVLQVPL